MPRRRRMTTMLTPFKHPLVLAVLLYLPLATTGFGLDLRLIALEPVAWASSAAEVPNYEELDDQERLELQNAQLLDTIAAQAVEIERLRQGYAQLAEIHQLSDRLGDTAVLARIVLGGDGSPWRHSLYINVGKNDGVQKGHAVTIGRTLIGRVHTAGSNLSVVQLITDPAFRVPVSIVPELPSSPVPSLLQNRLQAANQHARAKAEGEPVEHPMLSQMQSARGLLKGDSSAGLRIPRLAIAGVDLEARTAEGMLVVTNDAVGHFPAGLFVGHIEAIHNRNDFLEIEVRAAMDLGVSDVVTVLKYTPPALDDDLRLSAEGLHLDGEKK